MSKYIVKRLIMLIPVLIGVTFLVYFILSMSPGDTATMIAGEGAEAETIEAIRKEYGLDQPVIVQYGKYMWNLLRGDMGRSYLTRRDVFTTIAGAFPNTAKLAFWSILVALAIALPIGIISATRQYSMVDNVGMVAALLGVATPNFWLGLMLASLRRDERLAELHHACHYPGNRRCRSHHPHDPFFHAGGGASGLYSHRQSEGSAGEGRDPKACPEKRSDSRCDRNRITVRRIVRRRHTDRDHLRLARGREAAGRFHQEQRHSHGFRRRDHADDHIQRDQSAGRYPVRLHRPKNKGPVQMSVRAKVVRIL